jgi:organic radical activating enzyme
MKNFSIIKSSNWPSYDLKITLKPCFRCNQQCWFCDEYDNTTPMWNSNDCMTVVSKLSSLPKKYKKIFIYFYGGEPTLSSNWEFLHELLFKHLSDRELFIQTQTNMSISYTRLEAFFDLCKHKPDTHQIDICSSYHVGMQRVEKFIAKMKLCDKHKSLGLCFFSTEVGKERQMMNDFHAISQEYPKKIKMKFTVIPKLKTRGILEYEPLLKDVELAGEDDGQYLEYRYFTRKYPELLNYLEEEWSFDVDDKRMNYVDVKHHKIHERFKYMHCECGTKGVVIDHTLTVYHCNDDNYQNINPTKLNDVDFNSYLSRDVICLNRRCWDGLDFTKYKK